MKCSFNEAFRKLSNLILFVMVLGAFEIAILLQLILGVRVGLRVNIKIIIVLSSVAVHIVPMIACEQLLAGKEKV